MDKRWSLQGTTALVTGGGSGIGYAIVEELAGFGAEIHVCDISETLLNKSLSEWEKKGFKVSGSVCDVTSRPERETLMQTVSSLFNGKLDIFVNNVGGGRPKPTTEYDADDFDFHIATNLEPAFHFCQLSHPLLKASGYGSIVFISSVAGSFTGALNQLARNLASEWAKDSIRANAVAPNAIKTPLSQPEAWPSAIEYGPSAIEYGRKLGLNGDDDVTKKLSYEEDLRIWREMSALVERMCWTIAAKRNQTVIWQKPMTNDCSAEDLLLEMDRILRPSGRISARKSVIVVAVRNE
ncbi:hypothetical protein Bca101_036425 [Brassica carinata]